MTDSDLEQTLYEISVAGAFYGLGALSEVILTHLQKSGRSEALVAQGQAIVQIAGGKHEDAVRILDDSGDSSAEASALKALALKRSGRAAQAEEVLNAIAADSASAEVQGLLSAIRES